MSIPKLPKPSAISSNKAIDKHLGEIRDDVFGDATAFDNFRRRFFNRREALFSLIQDHPLLGELRGGRIGVRPQVALTLEHLRTIGSVMVEHGEYAESDKPDRRLLIAATEHVAVKSWRNDPEGVKWLGEVLRSCPELEDRMADPSGWKHGSPCREANAPVALGDLQTPKRANTSIDPLDAEETDVHAQAGQTRKSRRKTPLMRGCDGFARTPLARSSLHTSGMGLLPPREAASRCWLSITRDCWQSLIWKLAPLRGRFFAAFSWPKSFCFATWPMSKRNKPSGGLTTWRSDTSNRSTVIFESLRDRVHAYLETLVRAKNNHALLSGYHAGAENRNVVQLGKR